MVDFSNPMFWVTTVAKVIALGLGAFIVYLAFKGYKRNSSKPLLYAAFGFALITLGTITEGILYVLVQTDFLIATATGTIVIILGFISIIFSIYTTK